MFLDTATTRTSANGWHKFDDGLDPVVADPLQFCNASAYVLYYYMRDEPVFALDSHGVAFSSVASVGVHVSGPTVAAVVPDVVIPMEIKSPVCGI